MSDRREEGMPGSWVLGNAPEPFDPETARRVRVSGPSLVSGLFRTLEDIVHQLRTQEHPDGEIEDPEFSNAIWWSTDGFKSITRKEFFDLSAWLGDTTQCLTRIQVGAMHALMCIDDDKFVPMLVEACPLLAWRCGDVAMADPNILHNWRGDA